MKLRMINTPQTNVKNGIYAEIWMGDNSRNGYLDKVISVSLL